MKDSFLKSRTEEEQKIIVQIRKHVVKAYPNFAWADKENKFVLFDKEKSKKDGVIYAWMWFIVSDHQLVFRYKLYPEDNDRSLHIGNQIVVNRFHVKTIINLIDLIIKNQRMSEEKEDSREEDIEEKKIEFADFVVKANVFACSSKHKIEQVSAIINVMKSDGTIVEERITAGYCSKCNCYFMLTLDFSLLKRRGIPLCQQITEDEYRKNGEEILNGERLKPESLLHQCGYNVNAIENLSDIQRQKILCMVVDNGLYSVSKICSHLDWLIETNGRKQDGNLQDAIEKWRLDRKFISEYRSDKYRVVGVRSIKNKIFVK